MKIELSSDECKLVIKNYLIKKYRLFDNTKIINVTDYNINGEYSIEYDTEQKTKKEFNKK